MDRVEGKIGEIESMIVMLVEELGERPKRENLFGGTEDGLILNTLGRFDFFW